MKILILFLSLTCLIPKSQPQSILSSVEKAGDLLQDSDSKLSFEVATASLNFNFKNRVPQTITDIDENYTIWNYVIGISTLKGNKDLFSKGTFNPGVNFSVTAAHYYEDKTPKPGYWLLRGRINYDIQGIKSAQKTDSTIKLSDRVSHNFGLDITLARAFKSDFVLGFTASVKRVYNSSGDLRSKQVSRVLSTGNDTTGKEYMILDNEDRYYGSLIDVENKGEFGVDIFWNYTKLENGPSFALLSSIGATYSKFTKPYYYFSIGTSLQPPTKPRVIMFAILLECLKLNGDLDWDRFIENNFRVKLYAGIPFDIFK